MFRGSSVSIIMFCDKTSLAVIYADLPESPESPEGKANSASGAEALIKDIRVLEKSIWKHSTQKYLGIFTLNEGKVAPPFAEFAAFHASTETGWIAEEPGTFKPALQERLRSNGTTHLLFVGFEVAAAALEAKKQGFQVCIFQPATRAKASEPLEEMKAAGIVVAENKGQVVAGFLCNIPNVSIEMHCHHCHWASGIPRWCIHRMGDFLWYALMRVRMALNAVIDSGFEGPVDPVTHLMNRRLKDEPTGHWCCTYKEKREFAEAIDMAAAAGIPTGNAMYIASFLPPFTERSGLCEIDELKEEIAMLRAQLAVAEAKTKPASPSFYVSDEEGAA